MKDWFKKQWARFKAWVVGLLIAIGLVAPQLAYTESVTFSYTPATFYEDGTALPLSEIGWTVLYCNDSEIAREAGADGDFFVDLAVGSHTCHATHIATNGMESAPSNSVTKIVLPSVPPNAPGNLTVT